MRLKSSSWRPVVALAVGLFLASAAKATERPSVVVLSPTGGDGLSAGTLRTLEETLLSALVAEDLQVLGMSDVREMLGFERQKQLLGCASESCVAEVAGALGVRFLVVADVGVLGRRYVLNAKALDSRNARVVVRATRMCERSEQLADEMPAVAKELGSHLLELVRSEQAPPVAPWPTALAVRAGLGGQTGILGVGIALQVGLAGVALGTGTHLLSGGLFLARPGGGPYLDLSAVLVRKGPLLLASSQEVAPGFGAGASAGWDLRPVPWLSLKLGLGAAWNSAKDGGFLLVDAAVGYVHRFDEKPVGGAGR